MPEPSPSSRDHAAIARNLPYDQVHGRQLQLLLDVYRPDTDERVPTVLWLHDGGWRAGSKDHCPIRWLVRYGYAVATANYRLLPQHLYPAQVHDAKNAVRYLRRHADELGLNPEAFAAAGASTGGYLACMLGTTAGLAEFDGPDAEPDPDPEALPVSTAVQAVVNYYGFTDFPALQDLPSRRDQAALSSPEARFLGVVPRDRPELAASASPISHVRPGLPPMLHLHGEANTVIPLDQSRRFHDALRSHGNVSKLAVIKGLGHRGTEVFNHDHPRQRVVDFLHQHLAGAVPPSARFHGQRPD